MGAPVSADDWEKRACEVLGVPFSRDPSRPPSRNEPFVMRVADALEQAYYSGHYDGRLVPKTDVNRCRACKAEAELGTEEVPHPVDPRVHSCNDCDDSTTNVQHFEHQLRVSLLSHGSHGIVDLASLTFGRGAPTDADPTGQLVLLLVVETVRGLVSMQTPFSTVAEVTARVVAYVTPQPMWIGKPPL